MRKRFLSSLFVTAILAPLPGSHLLAQDRSGRLEEMSLAERQQTRQRLQDELRRLRPQQTVNPQLLRRNPLPPPQLPSRQYLQSEQLQSLLPQQRQQQRLNVLPSRDRLLLGGAPSQQYGRVLQSQQQLQRLQQQQQPLLPQPPSERLQPQAKLGQQLPMPEMPRQQLPTQQPLQQQLQQLLPQQRVQQIQQQQLQNLQQQRLATTPGGLISRPLSSRPGLR